MDTKLTSVAFIAALSASSAAWAQQSSSPSANSTTNIGECKDGTSASSVQTTKKKKQKASSDTADSSSADASTSKAKSTSNGNGSKSTGTTAGAGTSNQVGTTTVTSAATNDQPSTFTTVTRDITRAVDGPGKYNHFAVELNPLGLVVGGRLSFNVEWSPLQHHAFIVSPHYIHTNQDVAVAENVTVGQTWKGVGGEIGYRYYTGHRGINGIFFGPSIVGGLYKANLQNGDKGFSNIGFAADVGYQAVLFNHLVLSAGVGLMYLKVSEDFGDLPASPWIIAQSGIKPRVLAAGGFAF